MGQFKFEKTTFDDVYLIRPFYLNDQRGSLNKFYAHKEFQDNHIQYIPVEEAIINSRQGVLRGLHFQSTMKQSKLITGIFGNVQLVIVDVERLSSNFGHWISIELKSEMNVYIPGHYAVGTYAIDDMAIHMGYGERFMAEFSGGIRWDDPDIGIEWSTNHPIVAEKDLNLPGFNEYM
ncbi:MAG: dTDP-4-keto-6-deoxy-D-glucose epimerase [Roseburia sp.]|jgi:dTDP-4-dehydrorhamnose 3,5-epimerase|nr:dTDP-4-keto-6-deoxy-D-glucose epimerase [Roseburia sp.]